MLELLCLKEIITEEEKYILKIEVPKSMYPFFKGIFDNLDEITRNLGYKARLAEELSKDKRKVQEAEIRQKTEKVKKRIKALYDQVFEEKNHREAMKAVTGAFRDQWWAIKEFRKDIAAERKHKTVKLHKKGIGPFEIARQMDCSYELVRKTLKNEKENRQC